MSLSRRHFVHLASLSMLAGAALPSAFAQEEAEDKTFSPENLASFEGVSRQMFEPYVRERFDLSRAGQSLGRLTLIDVKGHDFRRNRANFRGSKRPGAPARPRSHQFCVAISGVGRTTAARDLCPGAARPGQVSVAACAGCSRRGDAYLHGHLHHVRDCGHGSHGTVMPASR